MFFNSSLRSQKIPEFWQANVGSLLLKDRAVVFYSIVLLVTTDTFLQRLRTWLGYE